MYVNTPGGVGIIKSQLGNNLVTVQLLDGRMMAYLESEITPTESATPPAPRIPPAGKRGPVERPAPGSRPPKERT